MHSIKLINLWNVKTGKMIKTLQGHADSVTEVAFSPDGRWLALANTLDVSLWDLEQTP